MTDISVIIACFNGAETLGETLDSLVQRSDGWEIVVDDNGSTDAPAPCSPASPRGIPTSSCAPSTPRRAGKPTP